MMMKVTMKVTMMMRKKMMKTMLASPRQKEKNLSLMTVMLMLLLLLMGSVDNLLLQRKQKEQSNLSRDGWLTKITKHGLSMMRQITACSAVFARNMIEKEFGLPVAQITSGMPVHD